MRDLKGRLEGDPLLQVVLLLLVAALFSATGWLKLSSFWMDAPRSLFEMYRASLGEVPYRDFTLPYPPLAVAVCGLILHWFGATFPVVQLMEDLLSMACVFAAWTLARRLIPSMPALIATLAFSLVGATNGGNFAMFSLDLYTPAILIGAIGMLLALIGIIDSIRAGLTPSAVGFLACGGFISCLGKPEAAAGILVALACLTMVELRSPRSVTCPARFARLLQMAALLLAPAVAAYAVLFAWLGYRPVIEGVTGYGLASSACPWWPTGFGLVGAGAALGAAIAILGILEIVFRPIGEVPAHRLVTLIIVGVGASGWLTYTYVFFAELVDQQPLRHGLLAIAYLLVSANTFVLPVMWMCVSMLLLETYFCLRSPIERSADDKLGVVLLGFIVGISTRELFNTTVSQATQATPMLYAIILPAFPFLIRRALFWWARIRGREPSSFSSRRAYLAASVVLCLFSGLRVAGYSVREARRRFVRVETDAGPVKLSDNSISVDVYELLKKSTFSGEPLADIAYGGGINFALHRTSPLYTTQFTNFRPTVQHRQRDYFQLLASKTRFVIHRKPPAVQYGTHTGCAFPGFVWKAEVCPPSKTDLTFPVVQLIQQQFRPSQHFGDIIIYERNR